MFAGIDLASDEHASCVLDGAGRVIDRFTISHSTEGFERLTGPLGRHRAPADLPIGPARQTPERAAGGRR